MPGTANSGGRNAKSTQRHQTTGTYRGDRHDGFETPEAPQGRPTSPKVLTGDARAEWGRMVDRLAQTKALSLVDDAALYQYVHLFAETEAIRADHVNTRRLLTKLSGRALKELTGSDLVGAMNAIVELKTTLGKESTQLRQGHLAVRQYLIEFGMTPSARTRVKLPKASKGESKLVAFMGGKASA